MGSGPEWRRKAEEKSFPRGEGKGVRSLPFRMNDSPEPESGSSGPGVKRAVFRFGKDVKIKKSAEIRTLLAAGKRYSCRYF